MASLVETWQVSNVQREVGEREREGGREGGGEAEIERDWKIF
jgi:hypothetical protein